MGKLLGVSVICAALAALGACAPRADAPAASCDQVASSEVNFTGGARPDTVVAHILGPTCAHAVGVLVIRAEDGAAIWAWSAPLYPTFGGLFAPQGGADVSGETIAEFAARWAALRRQSTADAPPWPEGENAPLGAASPGMERIVYEDVRARGLPMVCHLSAVAVETCLYWEPGAGTGVRLVDRPVRE